jgi:uncharacterized protein (TIGR00255 family)
MSVAGHSAMQSMTGYGRASKRTALGSVSVELRSTNHRYLEIEQRLPSGMASLQGRLAELIRSKIRRGRVEALVAVQVTNGDQRRVTFDEQLLDRYHRALLELKARFGLKGPLTLEHLLSLPQAVSICEDRVSSEQLWDAIKDAVRAATHELVRSRKREGAKLVVDLRQQLKTIERHLRSIAVRLPKAQEQQRQRLRQRLQELLGPKASGVNSQLEEALALVKDADVHEERIRLESHLAHIRQALTSHEPVGKQLDFIAQELMREANTMGAKVNDAQAAQHVFAIKGGIEKIREQVQNLE